MLAVDTSDGVNRIRSRGRHRSVSELRVEREGVNLHVAHIVRTTQQGPGLRQKDQADFDACVRLLQSNASSWLRTALSIAYPGPPWLSQFQTSAHWHDRPNRGVSRAPGERPAVEPVSPRAGPGVEEVIVRWNPIASAMAAASAKPVQPQARDRAADRAGVAPSWRPSAGKRTEGPLVLRPVSGKPIDRGDCYRMVVRIARTAGIPRHISPHSLRHAAITNALDAEFRSEMLRSWRVTPAGPRTDEHYDRARGNLDRHGVHFLTAYVAGVYTQPLEALHAEAHCPCGPDRCFQS